jgi:hypothetical protein
MSSARNNRNYRLTPETLEKVHKKKKFAQKFRPKKHLSIFFSKFDFRPKIDTRLTLNIKGIKANQILQLVHFFESFVLKKFTFAKKKEFYRLMKGTLAFIELNEG